MLKCGQKPRLSKIELELSASLHVNDNAWVQVALLKRKCVAENQTFSNERRKIARSDAAFELKTLQKPPLI